MADSSCFILDLKCVKSFVDTKISTINHIKLYKCVKLNTKMRINTMKQTFDGIKKIMCMLTLVFFVTSLTAASVSAGSNDTYKIEKAKLDTEKITLEKEKIVILKDKATLEKEKQNLEAQKKKLNSKNGKEYQNWLNSYNSFLTKYNTCLSKYKIWETKYNNCLNKYNVLEKNYKK